MNLDLEKISQWKKPYLVAAVSSYDLSTAKVILEKYPAILLKHLLCKS